MEIIRPESKQPMPAGAQKVFTGAVFDVYQWEQEGYDGSKHIFEKLKRPDTVEVIVVTPDKKIVVATQEQPGMKSFISLASGRVDLGEEIWDAAKREAREESGYISNDWQLIHSYQPLVKIDWAIFTFVARNAQLVQDLELDGAEKINTRLVTFEEFLDIVISEDFWEDGVYKLVVEAKFDPIKMNALKQAILG